MRTSATHQKVVATLLSQARLAPYLRATSGNLRAALKPYQWSVEMSAAVYRMLHLVEVFLRNAIDGSCHTAPCPTHWREAGSCARNAKRPLSEN